jgi:hypothetical protein
LLSAAATCERLVAAPDRRPPELRHG